VLAVKLLEEYIEESAGLYDLLHEADVRLDGNKIGISVDFDNVAELEGRVWIGNFRAERAGRRILCSL
jgi:hypothetical protein